MAGEKRPELFDALKARAGLQTAVPIPSSAAILRFWRSLLKCPASLALPAILCKLFCHSSSSVLIYGKPPQGSGKKVSNKLGDRRTRFPSGGEDEHDSKA